jgi:hypothetical protein
MTELARAVIASAHDTVIHNYRTADTRAEREYKCIDTALTFTDGSFTDEGAVAVVIDKYGDTEGIVKLLHYRLVTEGQIARRYDKTLFWVDTARRADAYRFDVVFFDEFAAMLDKVLHYLLGGAAFTRRETALFGKLQLRIECRYFNACAAYIDT